MNGFWNFMTGAVVTVGIAGAFCAGIVVGMGIKDKEALEDSTKNEAEEN